MRVLCLNWCKMLAFQWHLLHTFCFRINEHLINSRHCLAELACLLCGNPNKLQMCFCIITNCVFFTKPHLIILICTDRIIINFNPSTFPFSTISFVFKKRLNMNSLVFGILTICFVGECVNGVKIEFFRNENFTGNKNTAN